jgi:hypothetical protein
MKQVLMYICDATETFNASDAFRVMPICFHVIQFNNRNNSPNSLNWSKSTGGGGDYLLPLIIGPSAEPSS